MFVTSLYTRHIYDILCQRKPSHSQLAIATSDSIMRWKRGAHDRVGQMGGYARGYKRVVVQ